MTKAVTKKANRTQGQATAAVKRYRRLKVVAFGPAKQKADRVKLEKRIRAVIDAHCDAGMDLGGFAMVVWNRDGASTCDMASDGGVSPPIMIPDFVRNRLLAQKIEHWTIDTINESAGG